MLARESLQSPQQYYMNSSDQNMPIIGGERLNHHPHPPHLPMPPLPGYGGLYSIADMTSPSSSSFQMSQMSMLDATSMFGNHSVSISMSRGSMFQHGLMKTKDLNNYLPAHSIKLDGHPKRLFTVENTLTRDTIVVLASAKKIMFFILKIADDDEEKSSSEKFEFLKFHELTLRAHDLEGFAISQNCSISLIPFKLMYAFSTRSGNNVYLYDQGTSNEVPQSLQLENLTEDNPKDPVFNHIQQFAHDYPVTHLAIDSEKEYLACIQELGAITVWDINSKTRIARFNIPHQGVHVSFHRSEPYQLMIIDTNGWARFFNVFRQCNYRSINLVQQNVFAADWSLSNSNIFAAGFAESYTVIDSSKVLSSMNKYYDAPELIINAVKINPSDDKLYATLSRLTGIVQLWRENFTKHIWKHKNTNVNDIAWVHGQPYLLALGHQTLYIYDTSIS